ncbi:lasso peptide biosynthesis PqqD family chaperone [Neobacillus ginsengisoli]|uniref:Lasso peptide biosynthesis PqqD family chaperone n=1 Tax=Neobacillus ginsengisoli TaxID=904295 RepID=A0ABT9XTB8_9BACI|nr:lasso peptide biosynthesis PqqD family chaperone [Neobacillus ginsengisoli]MDQ0198798.1 hypothetical protein [Neobacillus ginsengisoli]
MITNRISIGQTVSQIKGNIVSDMGGEKVMLSVKNGKYYNLGGIGGDIWDLIEEKKSVNQLVSTLLTDYEVDQSECEKQVISFLELLLNEGLIEISDN